MNLTHTSGNSLLGERYRVIEGDGLAEIAGGGFLANCFSDFVTIRHVMRRKDGFGEFLLDKAMDGAVIRIEAPLVTSSDFEQGRRSYYNLKGETRGGNLEITIDYYSWYDRALYRFSTPLFQGRWMKRARCDTHEGNTAKVSETCGIPFEDGLGVVRVDQLPHIMRVFLGSDGGFPTKTNHGKPKGLCTIRAEYETPVIQGKFHLRDSNHNGIYQSFASLRANARYQIRECLNSMSGFIIP